jgi:hypothetical protein
VVYRISDVPTRISDHWLEAKIADSASVSLFAFKFEGHEFVCVRMDDETFAIDMATQEWCEFQTAQGNWIAQCAAMVGAVAYFGHASTNQVLTFSVVGPIFPTRLSEGSLPRPRSMTRSASASAYGPIPARLRCFPGTGIRSVEMRRSRDAGRTWSDYGPEIELGERAISHGAEWRRLGHVRLSRRDVRVSSDRPGSVPCLGGEGQRSGRRAAVARKLDRLNKLTNSKGFAFSGCGRRIARSMIRRASVEDAEDINDWIWRDSGGPDFTAFLSDRNERLPDRREGGALFVWRGPGIYEVHVFFEQRGKEVLASPAKCFDHARTRRKAVLGGCPVESRHVIMFTRLMGWKSQGLRRPPARPLRTLHRRIECLQLIAAGVAAVGSIGGAAQLGSQKKAANTAAAGQQQATDSQLQLGRENINFQQGIYDQNKALLSPFVSRGNAAGSQINAERHV